MLSTSPSFGPPKLAQNRKDNVKRSTSSLSDASGPRASFGFLPWAAVLSLPLLLSLGCQGELEGNFPAQMGGGSGGSSSGSGGSDTGSGGSGTGSGGSGAGSGGSSAACDAPAKVFKAKNCDLAGCHGGATFTAPSLAASADLGTMLKSQKGILGCEGDKMVDPAAPKNSVLYKRVSGSDCGAQMPFGSPLDGSELTDALTCLADWISKL